MFAHIRNHAGSQNANIADDGSDEIQWSGLEVRIPHIHAVRRLRPDLTRIAVADHKARGQLLPDELVARGGNVHGNSLLSRSRSEHPCSGLVEKPIRRDRVRSHDDGIRFEQRMSDGCIAEAGYRYTRRGQMGGQATPFERRATLAAGDGERTDRADGFDSNHDRAAERYGDDA